MDNSLMLSST